MNRVVLVMPGAALAAASKRKNIQMADIAASAAARVAGDGMQVALLLAPQRARGNGGKCGDVGASRLARKIVETLAEREVVGRVVEKLELPLLRDGHFHLSPSSNDLRALNKSLFSKISVAVLPGVLVRRMDGGLPCFLDNNYETAGVVLSVLTSAQWCGIYGGAADVFTADPVLVPGAGLQRELIHHELAVLVQHGWKGLPSDAIDIAKRRGSNLRFFAFDSEAPLGDPNLRLSVVNKMNGYAHGPLAVVQCRDGDEAIVSVLHRQRSGLKAEGVAAALAAHGIAAQVGVVRNGLAAVVARVPLPHMPNTVRTLHAHFCLGRPGPT